MCGSPAVQRFPQGAWRHHPYVLKFVYTLLYVALHTVKPTSHGFYLQVAVGSIRETMRKFNWHYAPTHKHLFDSLKACPDLELSKNERRTLCYSYLTASVFSNRPGDAVVCMACARLVHVCSFFMSNVFCRIFQGNSANTKQDQFTAHHGTVVTYEPAVRGPPDR